MRTGCQGPFCHGTGGWCGCNCNCCPPPCCPVISFYFHCGSQYSATAPSGCMFPAPLLAWNNLNIQSPIIKLPEFDQKPIFSLDGRFTLGTGSVPCSIPCETVCVEVMCGGHGLPCCCLELLNGKVYAVGNGYVTAPTTVDIPSECVRGNVYINGFAPPVFVNDCDEITITIIPEDTSCCECQQIDVKCSPCPMAMLAKPLWKRKVDKRTGKMKINPITGKPIIVLDKKELVRRVLARRRNK